MEIKRVYNLDELKWFLKRHYDDLTHGDPEQGLLDALEYSISLLDHCDDTDITFSSKKIDINSLPF